MARTRAEAMTTVANGMTAAHDSKIEIVAAGFVSATQNRWSRHDYSLLLDLHSNRTIGTAFIATKCCTLLDMHEI